MNLSFVVSVLFVGDLFVLYVWLWCSVGVGYGVLIDIGVEWFLLLLFELFFVFDGDVLLCCLMKGIVVWGVMFVEDVWLVVEFVVDLK